MKYYRARTYGNPAAYEEVEVDRESENSIWIKGRCFRKKTDSERFFKTLLDLKRYRKDQISGKIARDEKHIAELKEQLKVIESIPES